MRFFIILLAGQNYRAKEIMRFWWIGILLVIAGRNDGYDRHGRQTKHLTEKEAISNMMQGKGGTTVIETGMSDHLMIRNGVYYTCTSMTIHGTTITCNSKFKELTIDDIDKYCFAQRYSIWQNTKSTKYCIASDGEATSFGFNRRGQKRSLEDDEGDDGRIVECVSSTSAEIPTLFIDDSEYVNLCKIKPDQERLFVFYANTKRNIPHIPRANSVRCDGLICRFRAKLKLDKTVASTFERK